MEIVCEICSSPMEKYYRNMGRKEKKQFYICPMCKLIWAPELEINRLFHSSLVEEKRQAALEEVRELEFMQVNSMIGKFVSRGGRGLDVGCSYGWYMKSIGDVYNMEGIEPEKAVAAQAKEAGYNVHVGFFPTDIPKKKKYDFIVFNNVWEHINHTSRLIEGCSSHLEHGGMLFITIPLSTGGLYRVAELFEKIGRTKELTRLWQLHFHSPHIYYFTKKNLTQLMGKYGYELLECEDMRGSIKPEKMKDRFLMDKDEKHAGVKALLFKMVFPVLRRLPADKACFAFRYKGRNEENALEKK